MTGCGCLAVIAALIALVVIFIRGSFDAGEPVNQAALMIAPLLIASVLVQRRQRERATHQLVCARGA